MMDKHTALESYQRSCIGADIAIIDGVAGLFDGADGRSDVGSTAEIAKWLGAPVLLVMDCSTTLGRSAAAVVRGFRDSDHDLQLAGIVLNRASGPGNQTKLLTDALAPLPVPVLGSIALDPGLASRERAHSIALHPLESLNMVDPSGTGGGGGGGGSLLSDDSDDVLLLNGSLQPLTEALGVMIGSQLDLQAVLSLRSTVVVTLEQEQNGYKHDDSNNNKSRSIDDSSDKQQDTIEDVDNEPTPTASSQQQQPQVRVAVARDAAFSSYYQENLVMLELAGAHLTFFSPLHDLTLPPDVAGIYLGGGGYPELFGVELCSNKHMRAALAAFVAAGGIVYAESAGLPLLCAAMQPRGEPPLPMAGVFPFKAVVARPYVAKAASGYVEVKTTKDSPLFDSGQTLHGFVQSRFEIVKEEVVGSAAAAMQQQHQHYHSHHGSSGVLKVDSNNNMMMVGNGHDDDNGEEEEDEGSSSSGQEQQWGQGYLIKAASSTAGNKPLMKGIPEGFCLLPCPTGNSNDITTPSSEVQGIKNNNAVDATTIIIHTGAGGKKKKKKKKKAKPTTTTITSPSPDNLQSSSSNNLVLASCVHFNFAGAPQLANQFITKCRHVNIAAVSDAVSSSSSVAELLEGPPPPPLHRLSTPGSSMYTSRSSPELNRYPPLPHHSHHNSGGGGPGPVQQYTHQLGGHYYNPQQQSVQLPPPHPHYPHHHQHNTSRDGGGRPRSAGGRSLDMTAGHQMHIAAMTGGGDNTSPRLALSRVQSSGSLPTIVPPVEGATTSGGGYPLVPGLPLGGGKKPPRQHASNGSIVSELYYPIAATGTGPRSQHHDYDQDSPPALSPSVGGGGLGVGVVGGGRKSLGGGNNGGVGVGGCLTPTPFASTYASSSDRNLAHHHHHHHHHHVGGSHVDLVQLGNDAMVQQQLINTTTTTNTMHNQPTYQPPPPQQQQQQPPALHRSLDLSTVHRMVDAGLVSPISRTATPHNWSQSHLAPNDKIISLSPGATEMLWALGLGGRVVAVSDECDYPVEAGDKAKARRRRKKESSGATSPPPPPPTTTTTATNTEKKSTQKYGYVIDEQVFARERPGVVVYEEDEDDEDSAIMIAQHERQGIFSSRTSLHDTSSESRDIGNNTTTSSTTSTATTNKGMGALILKTLISVNGHPTRRACRVIPIRCRTLSDALDSMLSIGEAAGIVEKAVGIVDELRRRLRHVAAAAALVNQQRFGTGSGHMIDGTITTTGTGTGGRRSSSNISNGRKKVLVLKSLSPTITTVGRWASDVILMAGGMDGLQQPGDEALELTWKEVVAYAPDILIIAGKFKRTSVGGGGSGSGSASDTAAAAAAAAVNNKNSTTTTAATISSDIAATLNPSSSSSSISKLMNDLCELAGYQGWWLVPAVRNAAVYVCDEGLFCRPGPRLVDGVGVLSKIVRYGDNSNNNRNSEAYSQGGGVVVPSGSVLKLSLRPGQRCRQRLLPNYFVSFH